MSFWFRLSAVTCLLGRARVLQSCFLTLTLTTGAGDEEVDAEDGMTAQTQADLRP